MRSTKPLIQMASERGIISCRYDWFAVIFGMENDLKSLHNTEP